MGNVEEKWSKMKFTGKSLQPPSPVVLNIKLFLNDGSTEQ